MSEETNEVKPRLRSWREDFGLSSLKIPLLGLAFIVGTYFFFEHQYGTEKEEVSAKLAPNAIYISERIGVSSLDAQNEDVNPNGDGNLESVLYFKNPVTEKYEKRLIELDGDKLRFREFEVVGSEIKYLDDCLE